VCVCVCECRGTKHGGKKKRTERREVGEGEEGEEGEEEGEGTYTAIQIVLSHQFLLQSRLLHCESWFCVDISVPLSRGREGRREEGREVGRGGGREGGREGGGREAIIMLIS